MSRAWMPMYWGDYLADTHHYTRAEHGGYLLLIAYYWCNGGLPEDEEQIRKIAKCSRVAWPSFKTLMWKHFNSSWKHKRIDAELLQAIERSKVNSANAKRKHRVVADVSLSYSHSHSHSEAKEGKEPSFAFSSELISKELISSSENARAREVRFEEFWQQYPHKVGKRSAQKAWDAVKKRGVDLGMLIAGLLRYAAKTDDRPWCNPATWLNQDRWLDQPAANGGKPHDETIDERCERLVNQAKELEAARFTQRAR